MYYWAYSSFFTHPQSINCLFVFLYSCFYCNFTTCKTKGKYFSALQFSYDTYTFCADFVVFFSTKVLRERENLGVPAAGTVLKFLTVSLTVPLRTMIKLNSRKTNLKQTKKGMNQQLDYVRIYKSKKLYGLYC